jgi:hypothetical protein
MTQDFPPKDERSASEKAEAVRRQVEYEAKAIANDLKQLSKEIGKDVKAGWNRFFGS